MSIKTQFTDGGNKYWKVTTTRNVSGLWQTRLLGVIADSVEDAVSKVTNKYPDVSITSVTMLVP